MRTQKIYLFVFLTLQEQIDVCKLFGVNYTIHNIHYSRHSKNSFRITEVGCYISALSCMNTNGSQLCASVRPFHVLHILHPNICTFRSFCKNLLLYIARNISNMGGVTYVQVTGFAKTFHFQKKLDYSRNSPCTWCVCVCVCLYVCMHVYVCV